MNNKQDILYEISEDNKKLKIQYENAFTHEADDSWFLKEIAKELADVVGLLKMIVVKSINEKTN